MFRVSKGVRDLPGSFQSATSNIPSGKSLVYFGLLLASGIFFVFMAFTLFLPVIVLVPQKFAICFTLGCAFIIGSFFALKGPKNQFTHMTSKEVWKLCLVIHFWLVILYMPATFFSSHSSFPSLPPETSFYVGVLRQHDGDPLCFNGAS